MFITKSTWNLRCTNPSCGHHYSRDTGEPDVICSRCGGFVEVNERITVVDVNYIQIEDKPNDDIRSN
jgi:rRNA maturation endonuclease Nob1